VSTLAIDDLGHDLAMMARLVQTQLGAAMTAFFERDVGLAERVQERDDRVDNLLGLIEEKCFRRIGSAGLDPDSLGARQLHGVFRVAIDLEKLGDYAVNVAEQAVHVSRLPAWPFPFDLAGPARTAMAALDEVVTAFSEGSTEKAKHACRCEMELDRQYQEALTETFARLSRPGQDPAFVITHLFVAKLLERVGDAILNIGETTLFILTGERLKLHQYLHLEQVAGAVGSARLDAIDLDFHQIWGGVSGARVARLALGRGRPLLWKEGAERKIHEEVREMREWNRVVPELVPDVVANHREGGRESFLGQFLDGRLLCDVYLTRPWEEKVRATRRLLETVRDVWLRTASAEPPRVDYVRQITDRLPDLYAMHPDLEALRSRETRVFGITHRSLPELLAELASVEARLAPPVSVRIHGDFNTNNVIYDSRADRVHFIDVHRSGAGDYLQDVGVLLVSNLRHPLQDLGLRPELDRLNQLMRGFATEFARLIGDTHFDARLRISQARSLITSARLVTDTGLARDLYLRGVRLLERAPRLVA
jgi:phosphate uptake regulator